MTTQGNFKEYHGIAMCKNHGTLPLPIFCLFCILFSRFRNRLRSAGRGQQGKGRHSNQPHWHQPCFSAHFPDTVCHVETRGWVNIVRHFDGQGHKNSVIIYYPSYNFQILITITYLIAFIFVHILIFNNEPTEQAYRLMHLFIYEENRWTETVHHFSCSTPHRSDSGGH